MKLNKYLLLGTLLLLGVGLVLGGCGKKDNPFEPNTGVGTGTAEGDLIKGNQIGITPGENIQMTDTLPATTTIIEGGVVITFPVFMNAATLNSSNIIVQGITGGNWAYHADTKRLVITGNWANNDWYRIRITSGVRTLAGKQIDGNNNGKVDPSPYDDVVSYFFTGVPAAANQPNIHPRLLLTTEGGGQQYDPNDLESSRMPAFRIRLTGGKFDTTALKSIFVVRKSGSVDRVNLRWSATDYFASVVPGGYYRYTFVPTTTADSLLYNTAYVCSVKVAQLRDTTRDTLPVYWSAYGNIPNIPPFVWSFKTTGDPSVDYTPIAYSASSLSGNELMVQFTDTLDMSTINKTNVKVYRVTSGNAIIEPVTFSIYTQPTDYGNYAFRIGLTYPASSGTNKFMVFLSNHIKGEDELFLDGNGNGVGGEDANYQTGATSDDVKVYFFY